MISNKNLASISDKQNSGNIQDGGVQVNVTSALRKTGRTSRKVVGITLGVIALKSKHPHQNLTHGNVILVTNFLKTKMINC